MQSYYPSNFRYVREQFNIFFMYVIKTIQFQFCYNDHCWYRTIWIDMPSLTEKIYEPETGSLISNMKWTSFLHMKTKFSRSSWKAVGGRSSPFLSSPSSSISCNLLVIILRCVVSTALSFMIGFVSAIVCLTCGI